MNHSQSYRTRKHNVMKWYAPARFGFFCHWGLYTGGGNTHTDAAQEKPLTYKSPAEFEAAAGDPDKVAANMVAAAEFCGAKYLTLTMLHSNSALCVLYPTRVPGFRYKTQNDYLGAVIRRAHERGIRPIIYLPCRADHWSSLSMGPCVSEELRDSAAYAAAVREMAAELFEIHGKKVAGFWLDGMSPEMKGFPAFLKKLNPDAIAIVNNHTSLELEAMDYGTTEFLPETPIPPYCRPNALRRVAPFNISIPGRDFNEDIPTCCAWWDHGDNRALQSAQPYLDDRCFLLRQMISSLGQRGQWNFALGIGPRIDGTMPPEFADSLQCVHDFMSWGAEAIYNTTGGEDSPIIPGFFTAPWSPQGFCSVTRRLDEPDTCYILVTGAPDCDSAMFHTSGLEPRQITDLRTGQEIPFTMLSGIYLENVDWSDVEKHGVKVFKVSF